MNAKQWSRRRMARFTAPKCRAFPRRPWWLRRAYGGTVTFDEFIEGGDWYVVGDPAAAQRELNAQTPEDAYWSDLVYYRGSGTPEDPEGNREGSSYRTRGNRRGGSIITRTTNSDWQSIIDWLGGSNVGS